MSMHHAQKLHLFEMRPENGRAHPLARSIYNDSRAASNPKNSTEDIRASIFRGFFTPSWPARSTLFVLMRCCGQRIVQ
ncbi:hypothetical protein PI125_g3864 [Phytophthora idaei]|nr:hypothetical protein PI125_g3864 [Phytophthora idaei]